ncbi:hypothetical protein AAF712_006551 [Marasmius tenuissimus]|uniref:Cytosine-specific methyltransferase n=1 Tax=Marasmius tenuissimus TaxID=585030 RepID=A0ABR2ZYR0_9AGAR
MRTVRPIGQCARSAHARRLLVWEWYVVYFRLTNLLKPLPDDFEELFEDENLIVPGEDVQERGFEDDEDIPVRLLTDFSIYDYSAGLLVEFATLDDSDLESCSFTASGIVRPWLEPDEDDAVDVEQDFDYPRVKLSRLLELDIHHYNDDVGRFDGKIYLRTKHAWYILDTPAQSYQQLFKPFFIHHRLSHILLCQLLQDEELSMDEFKRQLKTTQKEIRGPNLVPDVHAVLGHSLKEKDLDQHTVEYLSIRIPEILLDNGVPYLQKAPIISELTGGQPRSKTKAKLPKKQAQRLRNPVVTPTVKIIVQDLFEMTMDVAGTSTFEEEDEAVQQELRKCKEHHEDPKRVKWGRRLAPGLNFYESVSLDGEIYKVISSVELEGKRSLMMGKIGDDVMVSVEEGEDDEWAAPGNGDESAPADGKSSSILDPAALITEKGNYYANHVWFCKISYFFDDPKDIDSQTGKPAKKFHGQWYQHGSRTILQETAHSRSLYLLASCDDNRIATIFRKCTVKFLEPGQNEEHDDKAHLGAEFHCSLMWDEDQYSFIDIPTLVGEDLEALCRSQPEHKKCMGCALQERGEADLAISKVKDGFSRNNIAYHVHDFVYLKRSGTNLLDIAQILGMKATSTSVDVRVKILVRRRSLLKAKDEDRQPSEEKQLVDTNEEQRVDFDDIDGKCFVRLMPSSNPGAIEEWIQDTDHWFLNEEQDDDRQISPIMSFRVCKACLSARKRELRDFGSKLRRRKLRGLELFAGAGGLGTGMDRSGVVETRWAVDNWGPAAKSYEANHPSVKVYCQDVNSLLQHAIDTREGKRSKPLESHYASRSLCPSMPTRGEVDFIFGGPPCQPYSGANHHKKADDVRSTLPCTMLSFVEEYEPDYFLLENVIGFLRHPLKSTQDGWRLKGGIRMGMTKMIVRVLIGLGYQVHFKVLQAGDYGSPQSRERIIFWGAKRGLKLPDFPAPTHTFESKVYKIPCNRSRTLPPPTRSKNPEVIRGGEHRYAPLKAVTIRDAIDDLPPFDWVNPHIRILETQNDKRHAQARHQAGIRQCVVKRSSAWSDLPGFPNGGEYSSPQTLYQKWMRDKMGDGKLVYQHVTSACAPNIVEA